MRVAHEKQDKQGEQGEQGKQGEQGELFCVVTKFLRETSLLQVVM